MINSDAFLSNPENMMAIMEAASGLFVTTYLFDLKENKITIIKSSELESRILDNKTTAQDKISSVIENISIPATLDSIKEFTTLSTLPERLKNEKRISQLFYDKYIGWCNAMFIRIDNSEPSRYVLYLVQNVNKYIKKIDELKGTLKENSILKSIIRGLMTEYNTVCSVDLRTEEVKFLRTGDRAVDVLKDELNKTKYSELINYYINNGINKKDISLAKEFYNLNNLKALKEGSNKTLIYRNQDGEYSESKLIRTGDNHVLVGFNENKLMDEMKDRMFTDSLTGVKNRKYYDEELLNQPCKCLVIADLDFFKSINDTYGHQVGDKVLVEVAKSIKSCVRKTDEIIRYGGDEFVLSFSDITLEAAEALLEKIRRKLESTIIEKYPEIHLSMSFGAAYSEGIVEEMLSYADEALYISKETRNAVTINDMSKDLKLNLKR